MQSNPLGQIPFDGQYTNFDIGTDNFAENPEPRCPVILLLDTSGSMRGTPIKELNAGIEMFRDELLALVS